MALRRVAAQGDVETYCAEHGYYVREWYDGDPADYKGPWGILVTDRAYTKNEFYAMKMMLLRRGIELISTRWNDWDLEDFVLETVQLERLQRKRQHSGGRPGFGYTWRNGVREEVPGEIEVVRRMVELRKEGKTYKEIREDEAVRRPNGERFSISSIQVILKQQETREESPS